MILFNSTKLNRNTIVFKANHSFDSKFDTINIKQKEFKSDSIDFKNKLLSVKDVKELFPNGVLENNYIFQTMKTLIDNIEPKSTKLDLDITLKEKDYNIIQGFLNKENGKYIKYWKGFSNSDDVANIQKLALFARTMQMTNQTKDFMDFDSIKWKIAVEGIIKKPKDMILPVFRYKINSYDINKSISEGIFNIENKEIIDSITNYIDMFTVKNDFVAYRGDQTFGMLSGIKYEDLNLNLAQVMEIITKEQQEKYKDNDEEINKFAKRYIIGQKIIQPRFMSVGMTESAIKNYAKKIKWEIKIPKGTKGASIESFNIEREAEAEFLGQRNGVLVIENAKYDIKNNIWLFEAILKQNPIDEIIINN